MSRVDRQPVALGLISGLAPNQLPRKGTPLLVNGHPVAVVDRVELGVVWCVASEAFPDGLDRLRAILFELPVKSFSIGPDGLTMRPLKAAQTKAAQ